MLNRSARYVAWCALAVALVSGCGGGGEEGAGEPRPSPSRSVDLPSPTQPEDSTDDAKPSLPDRTREPDDGETKPARPTREPQDPTRGPQETSEPGDESEAESESESEAESEAEAQQPAEPTPSPEPAAEETSDDGDQVPPWVWWLVAALVLAAIAGAIAALVHSRRKQRWLAEFGAAEGELTWFARELLPELRRSTSLDQAVGGWKIGVPRVAAAEDQLTVLEASAPSDADRSRARTLRDAARLAHQRLDALAVVAPHDTWALDLDEVAADLEVALGPATPPATGPA